MDFDHTRRWNIEETGTGLRVCRGQHDKNEGCQWEEYVPDNGEQAALARYRGWLQYIADIALDRDGCKSAADLGELVDELRECALAGLDEEAAPIPANRKHGDKALYPGQLVGADSTDNTLIIQVSKEWFNTHLIRMNDPCFVRGLESREDK